MSNNIVYSPNYTTVRELEEYFYSEYYLDSMLEEYKTLRTEIMNRQEARIKTLQFTIAILGAIVGVIGLFIRFTLVDVSQINLNEIVYLSSSLVLVISILAIIIIVSAAYLTQTNSQQIRLISSYIRRFIEKKLIYINWETRYNKFYEKSKKQKHFGRKIGTNTSFLIFYLFLTITFSILVIFATSKIVFDDTTKILEYIFYIAAIISFLYIFLNIILETSEFDWKGID